MDTKLNSVQINGVEYISVDFQPVKEHAGPLKIVILQRGWVMIGKFERNGSDCKLHEASVIRSWGTTKGLGELAENGPLSNTKLDKCYGVVEFDYLTVVATIAVNDKKWK